MWNALRDLRIGCIVQILAPTILLVIVCNLHPAASLTGPAYGQDGISHLLRMDSSKLADWRRRWEKNILTRARARYCDTEMGEELAWNTAQFLKGFNYGYEATGDQKWVRMLVDWTDAWLARAVTEPDGYPGWPKIGAAGTPVDGLDSFYADSLLGETMALLPVIRMSRKILGDPELRESFGGRAEAYIGLSRKLFEKWDRRGAWRPTDHGGIISVVLPFGIDESTGRWTNGYASRNAPGHGHSHPDNKANWVGSWLLSMYDATGESLYRERAEGWFRLMKSRMKLEDNDAYRIWNYWEPAGPWDYVSPGVPKHWIGVHPNSGYYDSDVRAIVTAYEAHVVFDKRDIEHLVATALEHKRYWTALVPYSRVVQRDFEEHEDPDGWGGAVGDALVFGLAGRKAALGPINATASRSGALATIKLAAIKHRRCFRRLHRLRPRCRRGRLLMVSPVCGYHRRYQAETPLIGPFKFARPAVTTPLRPQSAAIEGDGDQFAEFGSR